MTMSLDKRRERYWNAKKRGNCPRCYKPRDKETACCSACIAQVAKQGVRNGDTHHDGHYIPTYREKMRGLLQSDSET